MTVSQACIPPSGNCGVVADCVIWASGFWEIASISCFERDMAREREPSSLDVHTVPLDEVKASSTLVDGIVMVGQMSALHPSTCQKGGSSTNTAI